MNRQTMGSVPEGEDVMKSIALGILLILIGTAGVSAQQHAAVGKDAKQTSAEDVQRALGKNSKVLVIDVRTPQEFATGHIPGAINIPLDELSTKFPRMKIARNTMLVTTCEHGGRSSRAAVELQKMGYRTASYCTLDSWKQCGYRVDTGEVKP
jgi:phage shock protein E